jgi:hypothetical protein
MFFALNRDTLGCWAADAAAHGCPSRASISDARSNRANFGPAGEMI